MNSQSTLPKKRGRKPAIGTFPSRESFEEACVERLQRGWCINRIAHHFNVKWNTVGYILRQKGLR